MIQWLRKVGQTRTPIQDEGEQKQEKQSSLCLSWHMLASVQLLLQLLLWTCLYAYDHAAQAVWQTTLMLALPLLALWFLWKPEQHQPFTRQKALWSLLLLPCLFLDHYLLQMASFALMEELVPAFPDWGRMVIVAIFPLLTVWAGQEKGVVYGAYSMRFVLAALFILATVLCGARLDGTRLWPLLGDGLGRTALTALPGTGALWGVALFFLFPRGENSVPPPGKDSSRTTFFLWLPLALCLVWALWMALISPWPAGEPWNVGQRMTGISQYSSNILIAEAGTLFWLCMLPVGLAGTTINGEQLLGTAFPKLPRLMGAILLTLPGTVGVLVSPKELLPFVEPLLPFRGALSALTAILFLILAGQNRQKGRKGQKGRAAS